MRKSGLVLAIILSGASVSFAQKTEIAVSLNSGLSHFGGENAKKETFFNYRGPGNSNGYTNSPYGKKMAPSYGLSCNIKRVTKNDFVYGADLGYEVLRSKTGITGIFNLPGSQGSSITDAHGRTFLNSAFLTISPQAGYRLNTGSILMDITGGFDVGYCLTSHEKGKVTMSDGTVYTSSVDRKNLKVDFRPRAQVAVYFKTISVYTGYSYGFMNYLSGMYGGSPEAFSRYLRFGVMYRIK